MHSFNNQEQQQKNEIEKTKIYSLTLHSIQIKELTLIFDLLSKKSSTIALILHSASHHLPPVSTIQMVLIFDVTAIYWTSCTPPTFPHCAVVVSCLWTEMFAICPAAASSLDHECTICQIFFHSVWLLKNETFFGSSPQQVMGAWHHTDPWAPSWFHWKPRMAALC